jgi:hypothetical protein
LLFDAAVGDVNSITFRTAKLSIIIAASSGVVPSRPSPLVEAWLAQLALLIHPPPVAHHHRSLDAGVPCVEALTDRLTDPESNCSWTIVSPLGRGWRCPNISPPYLIDIVGWLLPSAVGCDYRWPVPWSLV